MSAIQSLETSAELCSHYYHCVLHDVPLDMPLSEVAGQVAPQETSTPVHSLLANHCKIVPHRLHMYKEPLSRKFGFITYFVHVGPSCGLEHDAIHRLVLEWLRGDLQVQMRHVNTKVSLGQPPECYSCHEFLRVMSESCDIVNPTKVLDSKKIETFVLSKVQFAEEGNNERANATQPTAAAAAADTKPSDDTPEDAQSPDGEPFTWTSVGKFPTATLSSQELVWLKKQATDFPPLLVTNNDFANAHCDPDKLRAFFQSTMAPLFEVQ